MSIRTLLPVRALASGAAVPVILGVLVVAATADVPATVGGGNIHGNLDRAKLQFAALNKLGAGMCRMPVSPNDRVRHAVEHL